MKRFDVIFDLRKTNENYTTNTKLVTGAERKFVRDNLSKIYNENNFNNRKKYEIDHSAPDSSDKIANDIFIEIVKIQRLKEIKQ